jgi:hypothetical protein
MNEFLRQPGYQPAKAYCSAWSDELTANFGDPELGVIVPVSETTIIWFTRASLENFLAEVEAGRGHTAELPRLLQVHVWPIHGYEEWAQMERLVGPEITANLQLLHTEAISRPAVKTSPLNESELESAIEQAACQSDFDAPPLDLNQVADIILTAHELHEGRTSSD